MAVAIFKMSAIFHESEKIVHMAFLEKMLPKGR